MLNPERPTPGAPTLAAGAVTRGNWLHPANLRTALRITARVVPTAVIARGEGPAAPLPRGPAADLDRLTFAADDGPPTTLAGFLETSAADAFLVLHRGRVVFERYLAGMTADQPHQWASMTKSVTGLLSVLLARAGAVDLAKPVSAYVPELADSPFGRATLQQNLDMEVAVDWPPDVTELHWMAAVGLLPGDAVPPTGSVAGGGCPGCMYDFLRAVGRPSGVPHGSVFRYTNSCTEAVAWGLVRGTKTPWRRLVSDHIWSRLGAEWDGTVILDPAGAAQASGGMSSTAGDLARFAELMRAGGRDAAGRQAIPAAAVAEVLAPYDNAARFAAGNIAAGRPGFSYHDGWFRVNDADGSFQSNGRFGQRIHVNPRAELTIVQFSAYPGHGEETGPAFLALARTLADHFSG